MPIIQSAYKPNTQDHLVQVDLVLECPYCLKGQVQVKGEYDWRKYIIGQCDQEQCYPRGEGRPEKEVRVKVNQDGKFWEFV